MGVGEEDSLRSAHFLYSKRVSHSLPLTLSYLPELDPWRGFNQAKPRSQSHATTKPCPKMGSTVNVNVNSWMALAFVHEGSEIFLPVGR